MENTVQDPEEYLDYANLPFVSERHTRVISAQKLAHVLGISGHQIAKTVLLQADGRVWMAVLQAPDIVDLDQLGAALDATSLRMLEEGEFAPLFLGCEAGAEPPFGKLYGVPVIVDRALAQQPEIVLRAGSHEKVIRMRFSDFQRLESPTIADFAAPLAPTLTERGAVTAESFINEVCWRTGIRSPESAGRAIRAALSTVGGRLTAEDAQTVAEELPPVLAAMVGGVHRHAEFDVRELYAAVQEEEGSSPGAAFEHAKVVCEVLSEAVSEPTRIRLQARLPPEWAQLFVPRQRPSVGEDDPFTPPAGRASRSWPHAGRRAPGQPPPDQRSRPGQRTTDQRGRRPHHPHPAQR